jgi:hypothetical protein
METQHGATWRSSVYCRLNTKAWRYRRMSKNLLNCEQLWHSSLSKRRIVTFYLWAVAEMLADRASLKTGTW